MRKLAGGNIFAPGRWGEDPMVATPAAGHSVWVDAIKILSDEKAISVDPVASHPVVSILMIRL